MVYITGLKDTLKNLKEQEEFTGHLSEYEKLFALCNPELCSQYPNYKDYLPAHYPVFLVNESPVDSVIRIDILRELNLFSSQERETLKMLQDQQHDVVTQIAMSDIMEELQRYAGSFRNWLKTPLVSTPWNSMDHLLTNKSLFKLFGESSRYTSGQIQQSGRFFQLDKLYEAMMNRDVLNRKLYMLRNEKGSDAATLKRALEREIKELTATIKQELPKKLSSAKAKYLNNKFNQIEIQKMRSNSPSAKAAKHGKIFTTKIGFLNRSGFARLRTMIKGFKNLGMIGNASAKLLNYGVVAYDTKEAYHERGPKSAAKTFITGVSSVALSTYVVSSLGGTASVGGLLIGTLAGDAALGATILIASPVLGWVCLIVAGVAVGALITYHSKSLFEEVWDLAEKQGTIIYNEAVKAANLVHKELNAAWESSSQWILDFYKN